MQTPRRCRDTAFREQSVERANQIRIDGLHIAQL
jgi:hypothetical protein